MRHHSNFYLYDPYDWPYHTGLVKVEMEEPVKVPTIEMTTMTDDVKTTTTDEPITGKRKQHLPCRIHQNTDNFQSKMSMKHYNLELNQMLMIKVLMNQPQKLLHRPRPLQESKVIFKSLFSVRALEILNHLSYKSDTRFNTRTGFN